MHVPHSMQFCTVSIARPEKERSVSNGIFLDTSSYCIAEVISTP